MERYLIALCSALLAGATYAGIPQLPPDKLAERSDLVLVAAATNVNGTTQFMIQEVWKGEYTSDAFGSQRPKGYIPLDLLPQGGEWANGDKAVLFFMRGPTARTRWHLVNWSLIRDGKVIYLGPRPGAPATGKEVTEFPIEEFKRLILKAANNGTEPIR